MSCVSRWLVSCSCSIAITVKQQQARCRGVSTACSCMKMTRGRLIQVQRRWKIQACTCKRWEANLKLRPVSADKSAFRGLFFDSQFVVVDALRQSLIKMRRK